MGEIYLSFPKNLEAVLSSTEDVQMDYLTGLLAHAYLPGLRFQDSLINEPDIVLNHIESQTQRMLQSGSRITLYDTWGDKLPLDAFHLLHSALRVELLKQGVFSVHAACVGNDDGYHLIAGHSGVGKTSLTLNLVQQAGMKIFSGNKTLIEFDDEGTMKAIAGTPTITIKGHDYDRYVGLMKNEVPYWGRYAFMLGDGYYEQKPEVEIKSILLPKINDGVNEISQVSPLSSLHNMYPYFMDAVNADTIVGNDIFLGTAPDGSREYLVKALKNSLNNVPVYTISGPMSFIVDQVKSL